MYAHGRLFHRGDEKVAACSISRATRLSLDDCVYKWNTKKHTGVRALITVASFSFCVTNAILLRYRDTKARISFR